MRPTSVILHKSLTYLSVLLLLLSTTSILRGQRSSALDDRLIASYDDSFAFDILFLSDNPAQDTLQLHEHKTDFYKTLDLIKKHSKKDSKRFIYSIYDNIHDKYFKRYEESTSFFTIFQNGNYNCVTGTAMYALALDYFNVPYKILEQPTHVYLVVFHSSGDYIFEATRPATSAIAIDKKFLKHFKKQLVNNKIASHEEVNIKGFVKEKIYNGKSITLKQLIGDLYINNAIGYNELGQYWHTLTQAGKSFRLHPTEKAANLIGYSAFQLTSSSVLDAAGICEMLLTIDEYRSSSDELFDIYLTSITNSLINCFQKKPKELEALSNCLIEGVTDTSIIRLIKISCYDLLCVHNIEMLNLKKANDYLFRRYEVDPTPNPELGETLFAHIVQDMSYEDAELALDTMEYFAQYHPHFNTAPALLKTKSNYLLMAAALRFNKNELEQGEYILNKFKEEYTSSTPELYTSDFIALAFGAHSAYFVRTFDHDTAKKILIEGLEYDPDNSHLLTKQGYLIEYDEERK